MQLCPISRSTYKLFKRESSRHASRECRVILLTKCISTSENSGEEQFMSTPRKISETAFHQWALNESKGIEEVILNLEEVCQNQAFLYFQGIMSTTPIKPSTGDILQKQSELTYESFWHTVEQLDGLINKGRKFVDAKGRGIVTRRSVEISDDAMHWPGGDGFACVVDAILDAACWDLTDGIN